MQGLYKTLRDVKGSFFQGCLFLILAMCCKELAFSYPEPQLGTLDLRCYATPRPPRLPAGAVRFYDHCGAVTCCPAPGASNPFKMTGKSFCKAPNKKLLFKPDRKRHLSVPVVPGRYYTERSWRGVNRGRRELARPYLEGLLGCHLQKREKSQVLRCSSPAKAAGIMIEISSHQREHEISELSVQEHPLAGGPRKPLAAALEALWLFFRKGKC